MHYSTPVKDRRMTIPDEAVKAANHSECPAACVHSPKNAEPPSRSLTAFLEARIGEDEYVAERELLLGTTPVLTRMNARVLAECAAKRAILAFDKDKQIWCPRGFGSDTDSEAFVSGGPKDPHARHVTRILAAVYADHPDYQQEWAL